MKILSYFIVQYSKSIGPWCATHFCFCHRCEIDSRTFFLSAVVTFVYISSISWLFKRLFRPQSSEFCMIVTAKLRHLKLYCFLGWYCDAIFRWLQGIFSDWICFNDIGQDIVKLINVSTKYFSKLSKNFLIIHNFKR